MVTAILNNHPLLPPPTLGLTIHYGHQPPWVLPSNAIHHGHHSPWVSPSTVVTIHHTASDLTIHHSHHPPWVFHLDHPLRPQSTMRLTYDNNHDHRLAGCRKDTTISTALLSALPLIKSQDETCKKTWPREISQFNKCPVQTNLLWPNQQLKVVVQSFWMKQFPPLINSSSPTSLFSHPHLKLSVDFVCNVRTCKFLHLV